MCKAYDSYFIGILFGKYECLSNNGITLECKDLFLKNKSEIIQFVRKYNNGGYFDCTNLFNQLNNTDDLGEVEKLLWYLRGIVFKGVKSNCEEV